MPAILKAEPLRLSRPEPKPAVDLGPVLAKLAEARGVDSAALERALVAQGQQAAQAIAELARAVAGNDAALRAIAEALVAKRDPETWDIEVIDRDNAGRAKKYRMKQVR